jgi:hypothetical protein
MFPFAVSFRIVLGLFQGLAAAEGGSLEAAPLPAMQGRTWCRGARVLSEDKHKNK